MTSASLGLLNSQQGFTGIAGTRWESTRTGDRGATDPKVVTAGRELLSRMCASPAPRLRGGCRAPWPGENPPFPSQPADSPSPPQAVSAARDI